MTASVSTSPSADASNHNTRSAQTPGSKDKERYFFLQRQSAARIFVPAVVFTAILLALTYGVHSGEVPNRGDAELRVGYYILIALAAIPIWCKLPITIPLIAHAISTAIARYVFCSDDHPDFSISRQSIWGLSRISYRRFRWDQIEEIGIRNIRPKRWFFGYEPVYRQLLFYTNVPKVFPVIGNALRLNHCISVGREFSETDKDAIIELVRELAPGVQIVETRRIIDSHF